MSFFIAKLPEKKAKMIESLPGSRRWMRKTNNLCASFIFLKMWKILMQKLKQAVDFAIRNQIISNYLPPELARAELGNIDPGSWK